MEQFQNCRTMLQIAVDIHNWESEHMRELETTSGRFIFLNLINYFCKNEHQLAMPSPLKSIYRTDKISEKSIRNKLKDFNSSGLVEYVSIQSDGRSKCAIPTNQMIKRLMVYSEQVNYIIRNHFYLVDIDNPHSEKLKESMAMNSQQKRLQHNLNHYIHKGTANRLMNSHRGLSVDEHTEIQFFEI